VTVLMVPDDGDDLWPSLGPQVCEWIEEFLVFGPGDLRGEPAVLDEEKRALIYRAYEVYPEDHLNAGRRRFKRVAFSLAKGLAKTEMAAWIAAAELHQDAPVRCIGWKGGEPIGGPVTDPYIPLVAYTEEQSDELAYGALKAIIEESRIADDFDIGLERIMRRSGDGKAVSLSGSPNARDGARTTFQIADETHWWTLEKLKRAHGTMLANLPKRPIADPWALEVTTAYEPGSGSVAESTMEYARAIAEGRAQDSKDSRLFFFHRQASDDHDLDTEEGARAAVIEASGPAASWRDIDGIVELWRDPTTDRRYWERVWGNRPVQGSRKAFDVDAFRGLAKSITIPDGSLIVVGFDGAQFKDATALVATHVPTGHQWLAGAWECPYGAQDWQVPADEVDECVDDLFDRFNVWRMYADPPYWQSWLATWQGRYGDEKVIEWWTNRRRQMAAALESYDTAIREKAFSHDGNDVLTRHVGNAHRHDMPQRDEENRPLWIIRKERSDSPLKIDAAMAAILSWEARKDAIAAGVLEQRVYPMPDLNSIVEQLHA
jgi:phage terminase large subunit-like protein